MHKHLIISGAVAALLLGTPAFAQYGGPSGPSSGSTQPRTGGATSPSSPAAQPHTGGAASSGAHTGAAAAIQIRIGSPVVDAGGATIGTVSKVTEKDGKVDKLQVKLQGDDEAREVPASAVQARGTQLVTNLTRSQIDALPKVN